MVTELTKNCLIMSQGKRFSKMKSSRGSKKSKGMLSLSIYK